ncbi:hypothetical protein DFH09DRAFT_1153528 [Mycena vulgaris]|nr:hypothetical protein DFH09DRAFT_1153528 [Mycena vulgaris]
MLNSSTPTQPSKPFSKRRRAFAACLVCRKRKIKCVTLSDADGRPCTRCAQKGIPCEYLAIYRDSSSSGTSHSGTPSPEAEGTPHGSGWPQRSSPEIIPPSAGIASSSLCPGSASSRGARRSLRTQARANSPYPQPGVQLHSYPNALRSFGTCDAELSQLSLAYAFDILSSSGDGQLDYGVPQLAASSYVSGPSIFQGGGTFYDLDADYRPASGLSFDHAFIAKFDGFNSR